MTHREIIETMDRFHLDVYARLPVAFVRGEGSRLFDADGKEYLDFFSGLAVTSFGHAHPRLVATIREQAGRLLHVSNVFYNEPAARLAELLVRHTFADRVFLANSGAEANEAAIKLARRWGAADGGGRYEILTTRGSFHGRTMATLSATGQEKVQAGFQPLLPGFRAVDYADAGAVERAIGAETVAVMVEPLQGEGGVNVPPEGYLRDLRRICDAHDLLLILDEVQVGMGRTGTFLACEHEGITPDVVTLAKALGGGLPIGAMLARETVAHALPRTSHGSTFGGNPVSCAAAATVVEMLVEDDGNLLARARTIGDRLFSALSALAAELPMILDVRGRGVILGIELDRPVRPVVDVALERGLVVYLAGEKVLRLLPPLVLSDAELERGLEVLADVLRAEASRPGGKAA